MKALYIRPMTQIQNDEFYDNEENGWSKMLNAKSYWLPYNLAKIIGRFLSCYEFLFISFYK